VYFRQFDVSARFEVLEFDILSLFVDKRKLGVGCD
jgi:hypothetical protein